MQPSAFGYLQRGVWRIDEGMYSLLLPYIDNLDLWSIGQLVVILGYLLICIP